MIFWTFELFRVVFFVFHLIIFWTFALFRVVFFVFHLIIFCFLVTICVVCNLVFGINIAVIFYNLRQHQTINQYTYSRENKEAKEKQYLLISIKYQDFQRSFCI